MNHSTRNKLYQMGDAPALAAWLYAALTPDAAWPLAGCGGPGSSVLSRYVREQLLPDAPAARQQGQAQALINFFRAQGAACDCEAYTKLLAPVLQLLAAPPPAPPA